MESVRLSGENMGDIIVAVLVRNALVPSLSMNLHGPFYTDLLYWVLSACMVDGFVILAYAGSSVISKQEQDLLH